MISTVGAGVCFAWKADVIPSIGWLGKFGAAPRAIGDGNYTATGIVEDHKAVSAAALIVVHEAIRTVETVSMDVANILNVVAHRLATMFSHAAVSHGAPMSAMGGKLPLASGGKVVAVFNNVATILLPDVAGGVC